MAQRRCSRKQANRFPKRSWIRICKWPYCHQVLKVILTRMMWAAISISWVYLSSYSSPELQVDRHSAKTRRARMWISSSTTWASNQRSWKCTNHLLLLTMFRGRWALSFQRRPSTSTNWSSDISYFKNMLKRVSKRPGQSTNRPKSAISKPCLLKHIEPDTKCSNFAKTICTICSLKSWSPTSRNSKRIYNK